MYFLKIKFIFRDEAFPVFHYQQLKNPQPQIILIFLSLLIPAEVIYNFFFSEGKYQAYSGSNCTLKPEYWNLTIYILYIVYVIYAFRMGWWHYVRLGWENSHRIYNSLSSSIIIIWHTDPSARHSVFYSELNASNKLQLVCCLFLQYIHNEWRIPQLFSSEVRLLLSVFWLRTFIT